VRVMRCGAGQGCGGSRVAQACESGPHTSFATKAPPVEHLYHNSDAVGDIIYTRAGWGPTDD
jgi:hypothetical protein